MNAPDTMTAVSLDVAGQTLELLPDRAVLWRERRTLIVADTHFGKSALLRQHGLAVPAGSDDYDRARLGQLIAATGAQRLIILGDFLHGALAAGSADAVALSTWMQALPATRILVIAGNHDRGARQLWQAPVDWHPSELLEAPFRFTHDLETAPRTANTFILSGHLHPVVQLHGMRKRKARVPVFWQHEHGLVLPSFGVFTGGHIIRPAPGERVYAAAPVRVVPF